MINFLPVVFGAKRPAVPNWTIYQKERYSEPIPSTFPRGVVCGNVSGGLVALDFDNGASVFPAFWSKLSDAIKRNVYVEKTPHGKHVCFLCADPNRNEKLARDVDGSILIETRGEGGFLVVAPSFGYSRESENDLDDLTQLSANDVDALYSLARSFDKYTPENKNVSRKSKTTSVVDDSADGWLNDLRGPNGVNWVKEELQNNGWSFIRETSKGELWAHPDASNAQDNHLQLHPDGHLFCYGTSPKNAPFDGDKTYSAFDALQLLLNVSAGELKSRYLERFGDASATAIDFSAIVQKAVKIKEVQTPDENGKLIEEVLNDVKENYPRLEQLRSCAVYRAPRPQKFLALISALQVVSGLAGRKLALEDRWSPNVSFCCVTPQAGGKTRLQSFVQTCLKFNGASLDDNNKIKGLDGCATFGLPKTSPELINTLLDNPSCVLTVDEFQTRLNAKKARTGSGGYESELLSLFKEISTASGTFNFSLSVTMRHAIDERRKKGLATTIDAPAVSMFATGTPSIFKALNGEDINDGLARRIMFFYNPITPKDASTRGNVFSVRSGVCLSSDLKDWIETINNAPLFSIPINDEIEPDVDNLIFEYGERNDLLLNNPDEPPLRGSYRETINKLATLFAFCRYDGKGGVYFTRSDFENAIRLFKISCNDFKNGVASIAFESPDFKQAQESLSEKVLDVITKNPGKTISFYWFSYISKKRGTTKEDYYKAIETLEKMGAIAKQGKRLFAISKES